MFNKDSDALINAIGDYECGDLSDLATNINALEQSNIRKTKLLCTITNSIQVVNSLFSFSLVINRKHGGDLNSSCIQL